jgi:hypothetical protein
MQATRVSEQSDHRLSVRHKRQFIYALKDRPAYRRFKYPPRARMLKHPSRGPGVGCRPILAISL